MNKTPRIMTVGDGEVRFSNYGDFTSAWAFGTCRAGRCGGMHFSPDTDGQIRFVARGVTEGLRVGRDVILATESLIPIVAANNRLAAFKILKFRSPQDAIAMAFEICTMIGRHKDSDLTKIGKLGLFDAIEAAKRYDPKTVVGMVRALNRIECALLEWGSLTITSPPEIIDMRDRIKARLAVELAATIGER